MEENHIKKLAVHQITGSHINKIKKSIRKIADKFNVDAIHLFRVEYKKLRSFLRMIAFQQTAEDNFKMPLPLKNGYHLAGSIRDRQLLLMKICEIFPESKSRPEKLTQFLRKELKQLKQKWIKHVQVRSVNHCVEGLKSKLKKSFGLKYFTGYANHKKMELDTITEKKSLNDKSLHAVRKLLKDYAWNLKLHLKPLSGKKERNKKNTDRHFEKFLDDLGKFQDDCASLSLLKIEHIPLTNSKEANQIKILKKKLTGNKRSLKYLLSLQLRESIFIDSVFNPYIKLE